MVIFKQQVLKYLSDASIKEFWVKKGHSEFLKGYVTDNNFTLRKTEIVNKLELSGADKSQNRSIYIEEIKDGFEWLSNECLNNDGGAFFGCSDPHSNFPLKVYQHKSTQLITEIDDLTTDEQIAKYLKFSEITGLVCYLISSGSKSIHQHGLLNQFISQEKVTYLRRLLCIVLDGDPAVTRPHQPFRFPNVYRKEKGNLQEILQVGETYSYEQWVDGLRKAFEYYDLTFPESISDIWWTKLTGVLNSDKVNGARKAKPITKAEKIQRLKSVLAEGEKVFVKQEKAKQKKRHKIAKKYQEKMGNLTPKQIEEEIFEALDYIPRRSKGSGTYEDYRGIFVGIMSVVGYHRALEIAEWHSPGDKWHQILESSTGGYTLGTLFYFAKVWGGYSRKRKHEELRDPIHGLVTKYGNKALQYCLSKIDKKADRNHESVGFGYPIADFQKDLDNLEWSEFERSIWIASKKLENNKNKKTWKLEDCTPEEIILSEDAVIPNRDEYVGKYDPRFILPTKLGHLRTKFVNELRAKGWKHISDQSQVGAGKSYSVAQMDSVLYLDHNYKNPSNEGIKNFPVMPPRTGDGIYELDGKLVADPSEEKKEQSETTYIIDEANCFYPETFKLLQSKGYPAEETGAPCLKCPERHRCHIIPKEGKPTLFKGQRALAIKNMVSQKQGRMHVSQLTPELYQESFSTFTNVFEEAGAVSSIRQQIIDVVNIYKTQIKLYELDEKTLPHRNELIKILNDLSMIEYDKIIGFCRTLPDFRNKFYGLNPIQLKEYLGIDTLVLTPEERKIYEEVFFVDVESILPETTMPDFGAMSKEDRRVARRFHDTMKNEQKDEYLKALEKLPSNFFLKFLDALEGKGAVMSVDKNCNIILSWNDNHQKQLSKMAKCNIYLNATASVNQIRGFYGIPDDEPVAVFQSEIVPLNNIRATQIIVPSGLRSNDWSEHTLANLKLGITAIQKTCPNVAIICPKKYAEYFNTPFWYGNHDRGSNELKGFDTILFIGSPYLNVGDVAIQHQLIYGEDAKFTLEDYYNHLTYENRIQGMGRSRAQWQQDKVFNQIYFTSDLEDISFLEEFGCETSKTDIANLDSRCVAKGDKTRLEIILAVKGWLVSQIGVPTQDAIGDLIGKTKQAVSKAMKAFKGGWKRFKKNLLYLINTYKGEVDFSTLTVDYLADYLQAPEAEGVALFAKTLMEDGIDGYMAVCKSMNATLNSAIAMFWLIAPLYDQRLENMIFNLNNPPPE